MAKEPKSEFARYAFGYSDKKPGKSYWIILGLMTVFCLTQIISLSPS